MESNMLEDDSSCHFPLIDAIDHEILMHRDAHFGGLFSVMIDYYLAEKKGVQEQFSLQRIKELDDFEKKTSQNLAVNFLLADEIEKISEAKQSYKKLRDLYDNPSKGNQSAILIADLILAEEEWPEAEIAALKKEGSKVVYGLVELLKNPHWHSSLSPGYGLVPELASYCLGQIADKRAIIALFEEIGETNFFGDDVAISALRAIGEPAKQFLLKILVSEPINIDNEKAAIALCGFEDSEVAAEALGMLEKIDLKTHKILANYLIFACESLASQDLKERFIALSSKVETQMQKEMNVIIKHWKSA